MSEEAEQLSASTTSSLRQRAEEILHNQLEQAQPALWGEEARSLIHELQVHQLELEMQNETLRQAYDQLGELRDNYADLYDFAPVGYFTLSDTGVILEANLTGAGMAGVERNRLIGRSFTEFVDRSYQDEFYLHCREVFKTKSHQRCELKLVKANGTPFYAQLESIARPSRKGSPEAYQLQTVLIDITEYRELEAQLRQAQKMEAIGQMAAGIAHNFNNLLTAAMGFTELSLDELRPTHPVHKNLVEIGEIVQRAAYLTRQLLTLTRHSFNSPETLDLNEMVLAIKTLLRPLIGETVELVIRLEPALWPVKVDFDQFQQVLLNLAVNARDAMPNGGQLTIETSNIVLDEAYSQRHPEVKPGEYGVLRLSDTGQGMSEEVQKHIFEPFFTTKSMGEGLGLGLSTCFGIIKQHGGYILVKSEPGQGATFWLYLPRSTEIVALSRNRQESERFPQGTEVILLVEDEVDILTLIAQVLRRQGYRVLEAENGEAALRKVKQHPELKIDLLLTDVIMPQMDGPTLANQLKLSQPDLKVLFISGYTEQIIMGSEAEGREGLFLPKPFTPTLLIHQVRKVLEAT